LITKTIMTSTTDINKEHLSVVISGHVDAGKSTTTGRLIYELGGISERDMEKLKKLADDMGKGSFCFAFYMDKDKTERERGITINCTTKEFFTNNFHYTIIDAPGHRDFLKNMLSGASQADVGVILVPADGGFEIAIQEGNHKQEEVQGQTRQHALLLNLLGVKQLIVAVNKMDDAKAAYSQARFENIRDEMRHMLKGVGWKPDFVDNCVPIVPISGWVGDNLKEKSNNMPWWNGVDVKTYDGSKTVHVNTLLDALNDYALVPKRNAEAVARGPLNGVYNIKGVGPVLTSRVEQGIFRPGDEVIFLPTHDEKNPCTGKIFSIEMHHKSIECANPGDNVGFNIKGLVKERMPKVGDVMIKKNDNTLKRVEHFTAQVQILDPPNELKVGYTPIVCVRTEHAPCQITKINWRINKDTGKVKQENPTFIKAGDHAELEFVPQLPFVVDTFNTCEGLARISILEGASAQMLGKVTKISFDKYEDPNKVDKVKRDTPATVSTTGTKTKVLPAKK
jgi:elongation factor 1-alpha